MSSFYKITIRLFMGFFLLLIVTGISCTERIDIRLAEAEQGIVIYGCLSTDTTTHTITITRTDDYFSESRPKGIGGAIVSVTDGHREIIYREDPYNTGVYMTESPQAYGLVGGTYELRVNLDPGTGTRYNYTAVSTIPPKCRIDSIGVGFRKLWTDIAELLIWGELPLARDNYMSLHLYRNGRMVNDSLSGFSVLDDQYLASKNIEGIPVFYLDQSKENNRLFYGDVISLRVDMITEDYAEFIRTAKTQAGGHNPILGGPPANIATNISGGEGYTGPPVYGYFAAYSSVRSSFVFTPAHTE